MAAAVRKEELKLAYQEFWPEGMAFPPTMPWVGTMGTRSALLKALEAERHRRGGWGMDGSDDDGVVSSAASIPMFIGYLLLIVLGASCASCALDDLREEMNAPPEDAEDDEAGGEPGTGVQGEDCPCDPMFPDCWC